MSGRVAGTGMATGLILDEATFRLFLPDAGHPAQEQAAETFRATNALPVRWVEPRDISNAVPWLASDEARYVTGVTLPVESGYTIK